MRTAYASESVIAVRFRTSDEKVINRYWLLVSEHVVR